MTLPEGEFVEDGHHGCINEQISARPFRIVRIEKRSLEKTASGKRVSMLVSVTSLPRRRMMASLKLVTSVC